MTTALYVRKGFEHRAPVTEEAFIEAWTLVCGIDQWQALDEFQEAVAYGDIYEVAPPKSSIAFTTSYEPGVATQLPIYSEGLLKGAFWNSSVKEDSNVSHY